MHGDEMLHEYPPSPSLHLPICLFYITWSVTYTLHIGKSQVYHLTMAKSDFQPTTTKSDTEGHPTIKTKQI